MSRIIASGVCFPSTRRFLSAGLFVSLFAGLGPDPRVFAG
jgi:hypothetical protein